MAVSKCLNINTIGYLLLLIYSAANLCDRSWGTREKSTKSDEGLWGWRVYIIKAWKVITSARCCTSVMRLEVNDDKGAEENGNIEDEEDRDGIESSEM